MGLFSKLKKLSFGNKIAKKLPGNKLSLSSRVMGARNANNERVGIPVPNGRRPGQDEPGNPTQAPGGGAAPGDLSGNGTQRVRRAQAGNASGSRLDRIAERVSRRGSGGSGRPGDPTPMPKQPPVGSAPGGMSGPALVTKPMQVGPGGSSGAAPGNNLVTKPMQVNPGRSIPGNPARGGMAGQNSGVGRMQSAGMDSDNLTNGRRRR